MDAAEQNGQDAAIALLSDPSSYDPRPAGVERIDTHGAMVFLAGERVFKIKRAVKLPYMDFSTLEKRRRACETEVEINRRTAPQIYRRTIPIMRRADGTLQIGGGGEPVEWAVEMARFEQADLLDAMAAAGRLPVELMRPLSEHIAAYHEAAPVARGGAGGAAISDIVEEVSEALTKASATLGASAVDDYVHRLRDACAGNANLLRQRARDGQVRRCHGDLHLRNIVLLDGEPTLFDAIEFDEKLATIDVLYDLAFLLMDLWHRGKKRHANAVLNRYLWRPGADDTIDGLAALPLFLSLRAAIRAMVAADRLPRLAPSGQAAAQAEFGDYFALARELIAPPPPRLVAVGGLSGTGKSTLAAAIAPSIGPAPGAYHLRSDVERKLMFGLSPESGLGEEAYSAETTAQVYATLNAKAARALAAGHAVVLDAVFARAEQRTAAARLASDAGVPFDGLWLSAPEQELIERVEKRKDDASDADARVVRRQLEYDVGELDWSVLEAGGRPEATRAAAARQLSLADDADPAD